MVNVPPRTSSGPSWLARARVARSLMRLARPSTERSCASWMTGTISPPSPRLTAMPRRIASWEGVLVAVQRGVQRRELLERLDRRPGLVGQVAEPGGLARRLDAAHVGLGDGRAGRRGLQRLDHPPADRLAHAAEALGGRGRGALARHL